MIEIFCFDCSCVFSMSCIICQNLSSLISLLSSSLYNLYLNKTFWKGKKKPNALKLCSKSQEGIRFATSWDCRRKSSWPWPEHRHPVHTKGKGQTHAFPCTYFSCSTLMNPTTSLFSVPIFQNTCFNNAVSTLSQSRAAGSDTQSSWSQTLRCNLPGERSLLLLSMLVSIFTWYFLLQT